MVEPGAPAFRLPPGLLLLPLLGMIALIFVCPLAWFFFRVFSDIGFAAVPAMAARIIFSTVVVQAIGLTLWTSLLVTLLCLVIAYPVTYYLTQAKGIGFTLMIIAVIIPYFTSVIVRTYSWMVLLGRTGLVNQVLLALGVIREPLLLMYNQFSILVGMTYILLPYMVLTLYAIMRGIDPNLLRAARSMGASSTAVFFRVHLPLSLPGLVSGSLIVFILAIGFFITPALMGGPADVTLAMLIEREVELTLNWPAAAIMALLLLAVTLMLYALYCRFTKIEQMTT
jgi:putative spermidine/putrescine transport system permease protein